MKKQLKNQLKSTAKIITSSALAAAVAFGAGTVYTQPNDSVVYASEDTGLKDAILQVKTRVPIPEECTQFDSSSTADENGAEYILRWETPVSDTETRVVCRAEINSKGDITHYNKRVYTDNHSSDVHFSAINKEDAIKTAKDWLFKANPNWQADFRDDYIVYKDNSLSEDCVYVEMNREKNGLDFCSDYVTLAIDKNTGEVLRMNSSYTYAEEDKIPTVDTAMSAEEITTKFFEKSPMELKYINADGKGILVYAPKTPYLHLNAQNGEKFNPFRYGMSESITEDSAQDTFAGGGSSSKNDSALTEEERKSIDEVNNLLSVDELKKIAESIKNIGIEDTEFLSSAYYLQHRETETAEEAIEKDAKDPKYIAVLVYTLKNPTEDDYYKQLRLTLDAKTGELESFFSDIDYDVEYNEDSDNNSVTYDEAKTKAESFIKNYGKDIAGDVKVETDNLNAGGGKTTFYIDFNRYANDVIFPDDGVYVSVNKNTGKIVSYYKVWTDNIEFESTEKVASAEDAQKALVENCKFNLSYAKLQGESKTTPQIGLRYELVSLNDFNSYFINAKTLKAINYNGEEYTPKEDNYLPTDIKGHYGEEKIAKLFEAGALTLGEDKNFRPDDDITIEEFSDMLQDIFYRSTPLKLFGDFDITNAGNLKNEAATREYAAQAFSYAAGYQTIAELRNIFTTGFYDEGEINPELLGCVAVCKGLGVISGDENNYFKPNEPLKRADAAIMLYNYLSR